jgi:hypothetical protein
MLDEMDTLFSGGDINLNENMDALPKRPEYL